jgi:hypothetical protein
MHQLAKDFNINPYVLGVGSTSNGYGGRGYENPNIVFVRDYFPLQAKVIRDGQLKSLFIKYPSLLNSGHAYQIGARSNPSHPPAPNMERLNYESGKERIEFWAETKTLPLIMEGGNILKTSRNIFIGRKIIVDNGKSEGDLVQDLSNGLPGFQKMANDILNNSKKLGWKTRNEQEVKEEVAKAFEIDPTQVIVLESMPLEKTNHIDLFLGVLDNATLAVPTIPEAAMKMTQNGQPEAANLNKWLDLQASQLEALGYKVVRVPMLAPTQITSTSNGPTAKIPSPVNWIIRGDKILAPSFPNLEKTYPESVITEIKNQLETQLKKEGYDVEYIDSDKLLNANGLLHCISAQYDLSEFYHLKTTINSY